MIDGYLALNVISIWGGYVRRRIRLREPSASSLCGDAHGGGAIRNSLQRVGCTSLGPTRSKLCLRNLWEALTCIGT